MAEESSDVESLEFLKENRNRRKDLDKQTNQYARLKLVSVAAVCLLLGVIIGGILQEILLGLFHNDNQVSSIAPNDSSISNYFSDNAAGGAGFGNGKKKKRENEDICSKKRCCFRRDGLSQSDLPAKLNCNKLSDRECGANDDYCEWDCDRDEKSFGRGGMKRRYRGISYEEGRWKLPDDAPDNQQPETLHDAMKHATFLSVDECGVIYEEQLPREIVESKWLNKKAHDFSGNVPDQPHSERRRLDILGTDDRTEVTSTSFPYRPVVYMNFNAGVSTYRCTATMISERYAITAAHCVYGEGDYYSGFKLYRDVFSCNDKNRRNKLRVAWRTVFTEYINGETWDYDIALLKLKRNSGLGYLDFGYDTELLTRTGPLNFGIISYPGDKPDCSKWEQICPYQDFHTHQMVTYECDTSGGASGAGVYRDSQEPQKTIYAIHAKGACYRPDGTYENTNVCNTAIMITQSKYIAFCGIIEAVESATFCGDQHPTFV